MRLNKLHKIAVAALEDIKAQDITVLDVRKLTSLYDTLIIASADSNRQVKALAHHVRDKLKEAGATIIGVEGEETGEWVLVDCGRHRGPRHAARGARLLQPRRAVDATAERSADLRSCSETRGLQPERLTCAAALAMKPADRRARSPHARLGARRRASEYTKRMPRELRGRAGRAQARRTRSRADRPAHPRGRSAAHRRRRPRIPGRRARRAGHAVDHARARRAPVHVARRQRRTSRSSSAAPTGSTARSRPARRCDRSRCPR